MGKNKKNKKKASNVVDIKDEKVEVKSDSEVTRKLSKHQEQLNRLKEKDPEFHKFLESEDHAMLNFDDGIDDSELLTSDEEADGLHTIPDSLEVASDEDYSDLSGEEDEKELKVLKKKQIDVSEKILAHWLKSLSTEDSSINTLTEVMHAYHACLIRIDAGDSTEEEKKNKKNKSKKNRIKAPSQKYRVVSDSIFNSLISFCMQNIPQSLEKILKYDSKYLGSNKKHGTRLPSSCKRWSNIRDTLRIYLTDVITLAQTLVEPSVTRVFLRHTIIMLPYYLSLPKVCKKLARLLIDFWGSSDNESIRILAFTCLYRLVKLDKKRMHENVLKQCYLTYVANCKFTSPTILPMIIFMQQSFSELCAMDCNVTYRFAFLYIRQLAIHLRKAIVENNKVNRKAVYNWQYVHCVSLWCRVLSVLHPDPVLQPLIYPLTEVALGMIDLVPTTRFYPLRFHVIKNLIGLGDCTDVYIPLLPFITAPLSLQEFKKKQVGTAMKPMPFECVLKLSTSQLKEKSYRDSTIDQIYDLLVKFFNSQAHTIAFCEMAVPTVMLLKKFIKECQTQSYCKILRQVIEKVDEHSKFINSQRTKVNFAVTDCDAVKIWETNINTPKLPFKVFFEDYKKKRQREVLQEIADKDRVVDEKLPAIVRRKLMNENKESDRLEFDKLFDEYEDEDLEVDFDKALEEKSSKGKKKQKKKSERNDNDESDEDELDEDELDEDELDEDELEEGEDESEEGEDELEEDEDELEEEVASDIDFEDGEDTDSGMSSEEVKPLQNGKNKRKINEAPSKSSPANKKSKKVKQAGKNQPKKKESQSNEKEDDEDLVEDFNLSDF